MFLTRAGGRGIIFLHYAAQTANEVNAMQPEEIREQELPERPKYKKRLEKAINEARYVEATWLCHALMNQRVNRLIEGYLSACPKKPRFSPSEAPLATRIACVQGLIEADYGALAQYDPTLLAQVKQWCDQRAQLVHDLTRLDRYEGIDDVIEGMARNGFELCKRLGNENKKVREWMREAEQLPAFPQGCGCEAKQRCIKV